MGDAFIPKANALLSRWRRVAFATPEALRAQPKGTRLSRVATPLRPATLAWPSTGATPTTSPILSASLIPRVPACATSPA